ncbi:hypothetical protein [Mucilaginibacter dorajii]|nr:hypothetical protein [Mucilaginibacter dorajii]MCS3735736.1 putative membrane protein [Mucilaginibacter dorajii]
MIEPYRKLTIGILISSLCILIGAGHGVAPMILFEVMIPFHHNYPLLFTLQRDYEFNLAASAIFLLVGQILLFFTTVKRALIARLFSLFILWVGFFYLIHGVFSGDGLAMFSFCTGIPFLWMSVQLFIYDVRQYLYKPVEDEEE